MDDYLPPPWRDTALGAGLAVLLGLVGRLMHHSRQVQLGRRRFWSASLLWELPVAVGTGFMGQGVAEYLGLAGWQETAAVVTVAYLGPGFVEAVLWRLVDRLFPAPKGLG
jgi:LydA holin phage, holin superfamily III